MPSHLISPHGGKLVDLLVDAERAPELKAASQEWTRAKRATWDDGSVALREAAELEIREMEFAIAEANRAARHAVQRWDRLVREYVDQFGLPDFGLPSPTVP